MASVLSSSVQEVFELVIEPLHAVKDSLIAIIPPDSEVLAETIQYSLTGGGKYLRPVVTLLSGIATGPQTEIGPQTEAQRQHTVEVAAVAEMIHVATLLHDDVIDASELRRGKPTVRSKWGNKVSVLSGDYLLAQASLKLSQLGNVRLVSIFSHVLADLCDGEVEQMHTSYSLDPSWKSYHKKTIGKTASLFSAGCESAGVINGLPEAQIQALKTYGRNFGIAFQIVDDLLDYTATEEEMGKPVLDDLRNGLLTAPILLALESERLNEGERLTLKTSVESLFTDPSEETIATIQDLLARCQAVEETRQLAFRYMQEAKQALDFVSPSREKQALMTIVDYITERRS
jgi:all-trans-nonaprenyl-diphosphate synthase